jgi:hypothetical protein
LEAYANFTARTLRNEVFQRDLQTEFAWLGEWDPAVLRSQPSGSTLERGLDNAFTLGQRRRADFGELAPGRTVDGQILSMNFQKTLESARAYAYGVEPLECNSRESCENAKDEVGTWPIRSLDFESDLLLLNAANMCPAMREKNFLPSLDPAESKVEAYADILSVGHLECQQQVEAAAWLEQQGPAIAERISGELGLSSESALAVDDIAWMWELCTVENVSEERTDGFCALFNEDDFEVMNFYYDLCSYWAYGPSSAINTLVGFSLASAIRLSMQSDIRDFAVSNSSPVQFWGALGESSTLIPLLNILGYYQDDDILRHDMRGEAIDDRTWRLSSFMPFNANIQLNLFQCGDGEFYVKPEVNEAQMAIPLCQSSDKYEGMCPFEDFEDITNFQGYMRDYLDVGVNMPIPTFRNICDEGYTVTAAPDAFNDAFSSSIYFVVVAAGTNLLPPFPLPPCFPSNSLLCSVLPHFEYTHFTCSNSPTCPPSRLFKGIAVGGAVAALTLRRKESQTLETQEFLRNEYHEHYDKP